MRRLIFGGVLIALLFVAGCSTGSGKLDLPGLPAGESDLPAMEWRGVWLRPPEDPDEIPEVLDNIKEAGFNVIYLETFYHGFVIYPGSNFPQRPSFKGKDVLREFLDGAHRRGIAVHCWTEVFYWQVDTEKYPDLPYSPVLDNHPEWKLLTKKGETTDVSENAHIFADPANPEVQDFLLKFYADLVERYNIDGVNLDYIRYSAGSQDAGYTDYARSAFKDQYGIDPMNIDSQKDREEWMTWVKWREEQVTGFVKQVRDLFEVKSPDIALSAAIFPGYYNQRGEMSTLQDWAEWIAKGYIDIIIPMAYAPSLEGIQGEIRMVQTRLAGRVLLMPALAISITEGDAYGGANHPPIDDQITMVREMGLPGHSVFCYGWILKNTRGFNAFSGVYDK